jgi:hypothetical protein
MRGRTHCSRANRVSLKWRVRQSPTLHFYLDENRHAVSITKLPETPSVVWRAIAVLRRVEDGDVITSIGKAGP